jgi:hypothetical protein
LHTSRSVQQNSSEITMPTFSRRTQRHRGFKSEALRLRASALYLFLKD